MKTFIIITMAFFLTGCFTHHRKPITYTEYIPPTTKEGKQCIMECEKIKLMKMQIAEQKYTASRVDDRKNRWYATDSATKDLDELFAEIEYSKCYKACGGSTREVTVEY